MSPSKRKANPAAPARTWQEKVADALETTDDVELLSRLCEIIDRASPESQTFDERPKLARLLDTADWFFISTGASGIEKFLWSVPHGALTHELAEWFAEIGASRSADYLLDAAGKFPDGRVPTDDSERQKLIRDLSDEQRRVLRDLDRRLGFQGVADEIPPAVRRLLLDNPQLIESAVSTRVVEVAVEPPNNPGVGGLLYHLVDHARIARAMSQEESAKPKSRLEELRESKLKASVGDVIELKTSKGLAYLQVGHLHDLHDVIGPVVRVLPGTFESRPSNLEEIVSQETVFWLLFDVDEALKRRDVQKVGAYARPEAASSFPPLRERLGLTPDGNQVWGIWRGRDHSEDFLESPLSDEVKSFGIFEAVSQENLANRIVRGWRPERDV